MASSGMLRRVALVRTDVSVATDARCEDIPSVRQLLVTVSIAPSSPIIVTLMMGELSSSETSALTTATRRNIPEDAILHSHRRENLKSYIIKYYPDNMSVTYMSVTYMSVTSMSVTIHSYCLIFRESKNKYAYPRNRPWRPIGL
jgi:hypothetical protein